MARGTLHRIALGSLMALTACGGSAPEEETVATSDSALSQCAADTVRGVDVYDDDLPLNFHDLKSEGYDFAIVKATESTNDDQEGTFPSSYANARAAGLIVGSYHFFRGNADGTAQARHFLAVAGNSIKSDDLPPALDIETTDGASGSDITQRMWDFLHTVEKAIGKKPMIYTYSSYFSSAGVNTSGLAAYPLWLAPANSGSSCFNTSEFRLPWAKATFWQYDTTSHLGGISSTSADHDKFIGTLADLLAFARGSADTADAAVRDRIVKLAEANVGKTACSTNTKGGDGFATSCKGDNGQPEYWGADFARWAWGKEGVADVSELGPNAGSFYCYGKTNHTLHSKPQVGDAVVFNYHGRCVADHVSIVSKVESDGKIETISGGWGGQSGEGEVENASTSHVADNGPPFDGKIGSSALGLTISAYVSPLASEGGGGGGGGGSSGSGAASGSGSADVSLANGCFSDTLNRKMPDNACVQSKFDDIWYQCDSGSWVVRWTDPDACNGQYPL